MVLTKPVLDNITRRLDLMGEICQNALDNKSSLEERRNKFEEIKAKYGDQ